MHEVAHQLSFNCGMLNRKGDVPVWLAEGLAVYCESTVKGAWQGIGEANPARAGVLAPASKGGAPFIPLRDLIRSDDWIRKAKRTDQIVLGYSQSWALFRLLMEERPEQLRAYLRLIHDRRTPDHRLADFGSASGPTWGSWRSGTRGTCTRSCAGRRGDARRRGVPAMSPRRGFDPSALQGDRHHFNCSTDARVAASGTPNFFRPWR